MGLSFRKGVSEQSHKNGDPGLWLFDDYFQKLKIGFFNYDIYVKTTFSILFLK